MKIIIWFSQLRHPRDSAPGHAAVGGGPGQDEGPGGRAHGARPHPASGGRAANQESLYISTFYSTSSFGNVLLHYKLTF